MYQKKCTMLDALCQGIESWWSVHSTDESKGYAKEAVGLIVENMDGYLSGSDEAAEKIMLAANLSDRAINITQTTAAQDRARELNILVGAVNPVRLKNNPVTLDSDAIRAIYYAIL